VVMMFLAFMFSSLFLFVVVVLFFGSATDHHLLNVWQCCVDIV